MEEIALTDISSDLYNSGPIAMHEPYECNDISCITPSV